MGYVFNPFTGTLDNTGPSTSPGGSDTNVQYNDGGVFGGDANNTWNKTTKLNTLTNAGITTTLTTSQLLQNTTAATAGVPVQQSPATQWRGYGRRTSSGGSSRSVDFYAYTLPVTGTSEVIGEWRLDYSLAGAAAARGLQYNTSYQDGVSIPRFKVNGFTQSSANNSSTIDTLSSHDWLNPTGTRVNLTATFGSTIRWGIQVQNDGYTYYKAAGSAGQHNFQIGSNIGSTSDIIQIYSGGIYNYGGMFATGKVTAGQADTSPRAYLNTYGSFAARNKVIEDVSYTIDDTSHLWFVNPINALCSGTATACSTYTGAGEATCNSHSGVGCSWTAAVTDSCTTASGTDSGTCTSLNAACVWESALCAIAGNNTDETTCTNQNSPYGGSCAWNTSTCPSQTSTASCNAITGCTATVDGDCNTLSDAGGDGTNCATQPECSYDSGSGVCSGTFFTACTGNLCDGTYSTGTCSGTYIITPAFCGGTALCSNLVTSGTCAAEGGGCSWTTGANITLPTSTSANEGNTSHIHHFVHIGDSGTATISPNTGSTIMQYSNLKLYKKGDKVSVSHTIQTGLCSTFVSEGTCTPNTGCTWNAAIVCADYNGNEAGCVAQAGAGCSYNTETSTCSGAGAAANCSGTYTVANMWVPFNYDRSKNYVEKTAAYTLTNEDDVVNYTSGSVALTLPLSADIVPTRPIMIKNTGSGVITLNTTSSQLIDGNASGTLTLTTGDTMELFPLSAGWIIV